MSSALLQLPFATLLPPAMESPLVLEHRLRGELSLLPCLSSLALPRGESAHSLARGNPKLIPSLVGECTPMKSRQSTLVFPASSTSLGTTLTWTSRSRSPRSLLVLVAAAQECNTVRPTECQDEVAAVAEEQQADEELSFSSSSRGQLLRQRRPTCSRGLGMHLPLMCRGEEGDREECEVVSEALRPGDHCWPGWVRRRSMVSYGLDRQKSNARARFAI